MFLPARAASLAVLFALAAQPLFAGGETRALSWIDGTAETLTLDRAIEMALANNLDVQFERQDLLIADARVRAAWGDFDPVLAINTTRELNTNPQNPNNLSASEVQQQNSQIALEEQRVLALQQLVALQTGQPVPTTLPTVSAGTSEPVIFQQNATRAGSQVQGKIPLGTSYRFSAEFDRVTTALDNSSTLFTPTNTAFVGLTLDQPLLRDFGFGANLAPVRINRKDRKIAFYTWQQQIITSVQNVISIYCDMVYALEDVRVREEAIRADQRLVTGNQRRLDVGLLSPIDVRLAQVALSEDQERLITAKNFFRERQFALKRQILSRFEANDERTFMPGGGVDFAPPVLDRTELLRTAFDNRPDYKQSLEQAERENIRLRFAKNQLLPKIDLVGTIGLNGLSESRDFAGGFANNQSVQGPVYSFGVQASIPFGNVLQRAQYDIARLQKTQALLHISQTELNVSVDVDTVLSRIRTAQQSVETSRQSRTYAEAAVMLQEHRMEQGQVSSFDLIDAQKRLYDARSRELDARASLSKFIVQLWAVTGTLLQERNITVVDNEKDRGRRAVQTRAPAQPTPVSGQIRQPQLRHDAVVLRQITP